MIALRTSSPSSYGPQISIPVAPAMPWRSARTFRPPMLMWPIWKNLMRIRDKVAASKRKGLWVGGNVCLGYAAVDRKIVVLPDEAETVRQIFETYARLGSLSEVQKELRRRGIVSK